MTKKDPDQPAVDDPRELIKQDTVARNFAQFIQMLEDGQFNADLSDQLRDIAAACSDAVLAHGGKSKATMTIKINFLLDRGIFEIAADFKTTLPKEKRQRTVAWNTPDNLFTPDNPRQMSLFKGPRVVDDSAAQRIAD